MRRDDGKQLQTLQFAQFSTTLLVVCSSRSISEGDWSAWCEAYARAAAEDQVRRLLVVTAGRGPDARQRSEVVAALVGRLGRDIESMRIAVCGETRVVRAVNMALAWLAGVKVRGFAYADRREALDYLSVPEVQQAAILLTAERFAAALERRHLYAS